MMRGPQFSGHHSSTRAAIHMHKRKRTYSAHWQLQIFTISIRAGVAQAFEDWMISLKWLLEGAEQDGSTNEQRFFLSNNSNTGSHISHPTPTRDVYPKFTEMLEIAQPDESAPLFGKCHGRIMGGSASVSKLLPGFSVDQSFSCTSLPETTHAQQLCDVVASRVTSFSVSQAQ